MATEYTEGALVEETNFYSPILTFHLRYVNSKLLLLLFCPKKDVTFPGLLSSFRDKIRVEIHHQRPGGWELAGPGTPGCASA